jgi:cysteine desulfurase/selenocysteine lyase
MATPQVLAAPGAVVAPRAFDVARVRAEFPVLHQQVNGHPLAYLDSAASSQKPKVVVDAEHDFALSDYANVHRGVHTLSQRATKAYDEARAVVRGFINAAENEEVIFTAGTTAGINLVAQSYARPMLKQGDEIVVTEMEHHSNIVPWQLVASATGARVRFAPLDDQGDIDLAALKSLIGPQTRIVAVAHVSNVLGTVNPVREIAELAHQAGAMLVVDGAQALPHLRADVQALGADFYVASGHKIFGPNGIGFLYGRRELLDAMPPWQGGGGMIQSVTVEGTTFAPVPARFEAGTPPITQAVGLGAAVRWMQSFDWSMVEAHEGDLLRYARERIREVSGVRVIGNAKEQVSVLSFVLEGIHPHDVGTVLDLHGVAVRASHHCAQPLMRRFRIPGTVRASFAIYSTRDEVDAMVAGLKEARKVFG